MKYLIINCHPYEGSFTCNALENIKNVLFSTGNQVEIIDLIQDNFNPVMGKEDLALWREGLYKDPLVGKYIKSIDNTDVIVIQFPVWWCSMPAVLKGFFDKVLLPGWAYVPKETGGLNGLLTAKKAVVIATMETPLDIFNGELQDPIKNAVVKDMFGNCGVEVVKYIQIDGMSGSDRAYTEKKMNELIEFFQSSAERF